MLLVTLIRANFLRFCPCLYYNAVSKHGKMQKLEERRINAHKLKSFWKCGFRCFIRGGNSMTIYVIVALVLLLDLINPKLLWYLDFWRYKGDKPEPSHTWMMLSRFFAGFGLLILVLVFCCKIL